MAATHPNAALIERFYTALARRDAARMAACYDVNATFEDAVFSLAAWRVPAMWRMLCERGKDLRVEFQNVRGDDWGGSAHWDAYYTFSATGRKVHNSIEARFEIKDGRIVRHEDHFNLHKWASQALGLKGRLLGWTPFVKRAIRRSAARSLDAFAREHGLGPAAPPPRAA